MWPSGRRHSPAKGACAQKRASTVRIRPSPPYNYTCPCNAVQEDAVRFRRYYADVSSQGGSQHESLEILWHRRCARRGVGARAARASFGPGLSQQIGADGRAVCLGGATDIQARVISKELGEQFGQSFVVDNRAGASGMIGAEAVVSSPADGYTILFTTAALAINATLSKSTLKFDPVKDLAPVIWTS